MMLELLSPAGSMEALRSAVQNGADAVYLGYGDINARRNAKNFTVEEYTGDDANICSVHKGENGYVIETVTNGYADDIRMLIGVSNKGTVTGLVVMEMNETFGLGAEALTNHRFLAQFLNTSGDTEIGTNVDALSGATVTSKAINRSILSAVAFVTGADVDSGATSWGE